MIYNNKKIRNVFFSIHKFYISWWLEFPFKYPYFASNLPKIAMKNVIEIINNITCSETVKEALYTLTEI